MDWHEWIKTHKDTRLQIAADFLSTVDFEKQAGMSTKSFYRHSEIEEIPNGLTLVVHYYFEDENLNPL